MKKLAIPDAMMTSEEFSNQDKCSFDEFSDKMERRRHLKTLPKKRQHQHKRKSSRFSNTDADNDSAEEVPSTSYSKERAKERAEQLIRDSEHLKASIVRPNGKSDIMELY